MRFRSDISNNVEDYNPKERTGVPYRGGTVHLPEVEKPPVYEKNIDPDDDWTHGEDVKPIEQQEVAPGYGEGEPYPYFEVPIPVVVRDLPDAHEHVTARFYEFHVGDSPVRIVGRETSRSRLLLRNATGGLTVAYIADTSDVNPGAGNAFRLGNTDDLELRTQDEIYAICADGESALICVVQEISKRT